MGEIQRFLGFWGRLFKKLAPKVRKWTENVDNWVEAIGWDKLIEAVEYAEKFSEASGPEKLEMARERTMRWLQVNRSWLPKLSMSIANLLIEMALQEYKENQGIQLPGPGDK